MAWVLAMLLSGEEVKAAFDNAPMFGFVSLSLLCTAEALFKKLLLIIEKIGDSALNPFYIATSYVILVTYIHEKFTSIGSIVKS